MGRALALLGWWAATASAQALNHRNLPVSAKLIKRAHRALELDNLPDRTCPGGDSTSFVDRPS